MLILGGVTTHHDLTCVDIDRSDVLVIERAALLVRFSLLSLGQSDLLGRVLGGCRLIQIIEHHLVGRGTSHLY